MQEENNTSCIAQYIEQADKTELDFGQLALSVSTEIYQIMAEKGITKADLAKRLGTSKAYVTKILTGDANLSLKTLAKIQNALNSQFKISLFKSEDKR